MQKQTKTFIMWINQIRYSRNKYSIAETDMGPETDREYIVWAPPLRISETENVCLEGHTATINPGNRALTAQWYR